MSYCLVFAETAAGLEREMGHGKMERRNEVVANNVVFWYCKF
jgi:hypothetical protein